MKNSKILVVDDEEVICKSCQRILSKAGYNVTTTQSPEDALKKVKETVFDVVVTDLVMPKIGGIELLKAVKSINPDIQIIIITGYGTIKNVVEAMKDGAHNYITKPFEPKELIAAVEKAIEEKILSSLPPPPTECKDTTPHFNNIIGQSPKILEVFKLIHRVAATNSTVLVIGESGTGKELVACAIHDNSHRKNMNFVAVDCTTLSPTLLESELFGHVKGSFTGAVSARQGYFETANGGTLFLDEVGNLSLDIQGKLLRVLQEREFTPVGGTEAKKINIRLIAATNKDLEAMVENGTFRDDLFYRLYVVPMHLPPLRERKEDIELLAYHFLSSYNKEMGKNITKISPDTIRLMSNFEWPGNIRQLQNIIERMVITTTGDTIEVSELPTLLKNAKDDIRGALVPDNVEELKEIKKSIRKKSVEETERLFILKSLSRN
ncbi:MAG: sigma-54 dependent transcriptional regulator, partial [Planctomycetota bacterium]